MILRCYLSAFFLKKTSGEISFYLYASESNFFTFYVRIGLEQTNIFSTLVEVRQVVCT